MNGFINILKPPGMTSAAVVAVVKRLTGEKHIGHAGTLDPEAAGILPVMVGRAARLFDYLVDKEKTYVAEAAFGKATDTQDATGTVTETGSAYPPYEAIEKACLSLTGDIWQRPSVYSAIKKDGKPMYERARKGEDVEVPLRQVHVEAITLMGETANHGVLMRVDCGRGTYIRSICHDLGVLTGCPAHMRFLLRAKSGAFDLSSAVTIEELTAAAQEGKIPQLMIGLDVPLQHMHRVDVPISMGKLVKNGVKLPMSRVPGSAALEEGAVTRVYYQDQFWGICERKGDALSWRAQIPPEDHQME